MLRRVASLVGFCVVALLATLIVQVVWSGMLVTNLTVSPTFPWAVVVMALLVWAIWQYFGGAWPPARTSQARRRYRRAEPVPGRTFAWAMVAGLLALGALIAVWLVVGQLVKVPGNSTLKYSEYSPVTVVLVVAMASVVGAVTEELGLRGYLLTRLQSHVNGWVAVVTVALVISPGHGMTQGFAVPTLLWYFAADLMFGALALLTRSILPGILVHLVGLLTFFSLVWPTDKDRHPASLGQQGSGFWIDALACVVLAVLSLLAFRQLKSIVSRPASDPVRVAEQTSSGS